MGKEGSRREPSQASAPNTRQTEQWEDRKRDGEDEINEFLKPKETAEMKGNEIKNNGAWIKVAKHRERWKAVESEYATTAAAAVCTADNVLRKIQFDPHAT